MKKWVIVALVCIVALAMVSMASAVELKPSVKVEVEQDMDADEMVTEVKFNLGVAPFAFELEYDKSLTYDTDATLAFIAAVDIGLLNFEWDTPLTSDELGDLTTTLKFSPFTFEWEKPLGNDQMGTFTVTYKKAW